MTEKPASPVELWPGHPTCVERIKATVSLTVLLSIGVNVLFIMPIWVKGLIFVTALVAGVLGGITAHLYRHRSRETPGACEACLTFEQAVWFYGGGVYVLAWLVPSTSDHAGFIGTGAALLSVSLALAWWYAFRFPRLLWHARPAVDPGRLHFAPLDLAGAPFSLEVPVGSAARPETEGRFIVEAPLGAGWGTMRISFCQTDRLHPQKPAHPVVLRERLAVAGVPALLTSHRLAERGTLALRFVLVPWLVEIVLEETWLADPVELLRHIGRSVRRRDEDSVQLAELLLSIPEGRL